MTTCLVVSGKHFRRAVVRLAGGPGLMATASLKKDLGRLHVTPAAAALADRHQSGMVIGAVAENYWKMCLFERERRLRRPS